MVVWGSQQGLGLLALLVFGGGSFGIGALVVGGLLAVGAAVSAVRWSRFTWAVEAGNLVIEQGLLQRSRRVIPADRVQSVDLIRPLRHRALGVVQVRVEAIGGTDSEGVLEALDEPTAFALQRALLGERAARRSGGTTVGPTAGAGPPPSAPRQLVQVSPRDLVLAGLTGGRVGVVAALLAAAQQVLGDRFDQLAGLVPLGAGLAALVLLAVVGVVIVFALSVLATVVSYWDFTVMRDEEELRISRGLLETRLETVPLSRIQSLRIEQNLLRRLVGLASVRADLAGRVGAGQDQATGLLLPIAPVDTARRLVADLLGSAEPVALTLTPPPARSRRRYVVRGLGVGVLLAALGGLAVAAGGSPWVPVVAGVVGAGVGVPTAVAWWSALGSGRSDGVLVARTGLVVRRRVHVPVGRVQRMSVRSSPFQRRLGLGDVRLGIARSGGWAGPRMPELDLDDALTLTATTVHDAVEASRRRPGRTAR